MNEKRYPITKSNFVTPQDFKNAYGVDLTIEMRDGTRTPDSFLAEQERNLKQFIDKAAFRTYRWEDVEANANWRDAMQMAILAQAYYVYRNSDIATDSGYDPDKGPINSLDDNKKRAISQQAYDYLHDVGLLNRTLSNNLGKKWEY